MNKGNKEKYRVSICPMCGHVRICHAGFNLVSYCYGAGQEDLPPSLNLFSKRPDTYTESEPFSGAVYRYYSHYPDFHEITLMNSTESYFTNEEIKIITGRSPIKPLSFR